MCRTRIRHAVGRGEEGGGGGRGGGGEEIMMVGFPAACRPRYKRVPSWDDEDSGK